MQLQVSRDDLLSFEGDGLVVPIDSTGFMTSGIPARIKAIVGQAVEDEVVSHTPIAVGAAFATDGAPLAVRRLIHAPIVEEPGQRIGVENIRRSMRASLLAADHYELERIAAPALGFGENGVSHEEAARAMIDECTGFKAPFPQLVVITTDDPLMHEALLAQISGR